MASNEGLPKGLKLLRSLSKWLFFTIEGLFVKARKYVMLEDLKLL